MLLSKLKTLSLVLLAMMACATAGGLLRHANAADPPGGRPPTAVSQLGGSDQRADAKSSRPKDAEAGRVMTAAEVVSVFDKNEAAGEDRFLGKTVRATGRVRKVERVSWSNMAPPPIAVSDVNYYVLSLRADRADGVEAKGEKGGRNEKALPAVFVFPVGERNPLGGLEDGQQVTVEGVCRGRVEGTLVFTRSRVVKGK